MSIACCRVATGSFFVPLQLSFPVGETYIAFSEHAVISIIAIIKGKNNLPVTSNRQEIISQEKFRKSLIYFHYPVLSKS
jgi:hypothetical protein